MLERVEIIPSSRKSLRRAVSLGCELVSRSDVRMERVLDLSPRGARVHSRASLRRGEEVLMTFVPPNGRARRVSALGSVRHFEDGIAGVEFFSLDRIDENELGARLRGLPPPLPKTRVARMELVWVDCLLTWEEDLGDRVNVFEVSERIHAIDDSEITIAPLAPMLTASAPAYEWKVA